MHSSRLAFSYILESRAYWPRELLYNNAGHKKRAQRRGARDAMVGGGGKVELEAAGLRKLTGGDFYLRPIYLYEFGRGDRI